MSIFHCRSFPQQLLASEMLQQSTPQGAEAALDKTVCDVKPGCPGILHIPGWQCLTHAPSSGCSQDFDKCQITSKSNCQAMTGLGCISHVNSVPEHWLWPCWPRPKSPQYATWRQQSEESPVCTSGSVGARLVGGLQTAVRATAWSALTQLLPFCHFSTRTLPVSVMTKHNHALICPWTSSVGELQLGCWMNGCLGQPRRTPKKLYHEQIEDFNGIHSILEEHYLNWSH